MSDFIKLKSGYTINPAAISVINLTNPGKVTVHVGSSALDFEGDDAKELHDQFGVPPDEKEHEHEHEHGHEHGHEEPEDDEEDAPSAGPVGPGTAGPAIDASGPKGATPARGAAAPPSGPAGAPAAPLKEKKPANHLEAQALEEKRRLAKR